MFGEIEFDPANIIKFPNGLVGFDEQKEYKLLHSEEYEGLRWLQSVTDADLAFSLMEPGDLGYELEITLSDSETELLACSDANDLIVFLLVYEDKNQASDENSERAMQASWRSPIIVNPSNCIGYQKVLNDIQKATIIRGN